MNRITKFAALISFLFAFSAIPSTAHAGEVYISVPKIVIGVGGHYGYGDRYYGKKYVKKKYYNYNYKPYYNNYYGKSYRKGYSSGYSKGYKQGYKNSYKSKRYYYRGY